MNVQFLVLAFYAGLVLDVVWRFGIQIGGKEYHLPDKEITEPHLKFVTWLEHYHWTLVILATYPFHKSLELVAFGLALLIGEHFQKHPYALKSSHFYESTIIGISLILLVVAAWLL